MKRLLITGALLFGSIGFSWQGFSACYDAQGHGNTDRTDYRDGRYKLQGDFNFFPTQSGDYASCVCDEGDYLLNGGIGWRCWVDLGRESPDQKADVSIIAYCKKGAS